ncbi:MAG: hypothetical protein JNL18_16205, partial [Planctomycetaceae bacterium]|nr:hypothetical protein [Planctomycetaceae bacterium]
MSLTAETTESVHATRAWQAAFIEMAPTIERYARVAFRKLAPEERDEAVQTTLAAAAVDYARLAASGRGGRAYPTTLARFAVRRYRAGRLLGSRDNAADVGSRKWRLRGR